MNLMRRLRPVMLKALFSSCFVQQTCTNATSNTSTNNNGSNVNNQLILSHELMCSWQSLGIISAAARMRYSLIFCPSCCLDGSLAVSTADAVSFSNAAVFFRMCSAVISWIELSHSQWVAIVRQGFAPCHPLVRINRSSREALQALQELGVAARVRQQSSVPMRQSEELAHGLVAASGLTPSKTGWDRRP